MIWSHLQPFWYALIRRVSQVTFSTFHGIRVTGREHVPAVGGALIVCNHQSFLDPMLVGLGLPRPLHYMARESLFHMPVLRELMTSLNGYPVRLGEADLGAIRETMRLVRDGQMVVIFPEGTRTRTGQIGPFQPGFAVLARKCRVPVVPAAIAGAFEAWPRTAPLPMPGAIRVGFGPALSPEETAARTPEQLSVEVRGRIENLYARLSRQQARQLRLPTEGGTLSPPREVPT